MNVDEETIRQIEKLQAIQRKQRENEEAACVGLSNADWMAWKDAQTQRAKDEDDERKRERKAIGCQECKLVKAELGDRWFCENCGRKYLANGRMVERAPDSEEDLADAVAKDDAGKLRWSLLPWGPLRHVVEVMEFGAKKYGADSWKHVPAHRYREALLRHAVALASGEEIDGESGKHHAAHVVCNALFMLHFWGGK